MLTAQNVRVAPEVRNFGLIVSAQFENIGQAWQACIRDQGGKKIADVQLAGESIEAAAQAARDYATEILGVLEPQVTSIKRLSSQLVVPKGLRPRPVRLERGDKAPEAEPVAAAE